MNLMLHHTYHVLLQFFISLSIIKDGVEKDVKVERALQLLRDHFDIITVGQHDRFESEFLKITGLEKIPMQTKNVYRKELNFTKKEIETLHRLLEENGDIDFIYELKKMYNDNKIDT